jgi:hypothetical protein
MPTMTDQDKMELEALRAENEALKRQAAGAKRDGIGVKISEKGAICVYGLGRFPVSLYASQWARLLTDGVQAIKAVALDNPTAWAVAEGQDRASILEAFKAL